MKVPFVTFKPMHDEINEEIINKFSEVFHKNIFIKGDEVKTFEEEFAQYCDTKYAVGVATGLDALYLILKAMEIGDDDEVIVPSNTYIATALAVSFAGATPVFVEPMLETYEINPKLIEEKITSRTKAIIAVHLQGRAADMDLINEIAKKYNLPSKNYISNWEQQLKDKGVLDRIATKPHKTVGRAKESVVYEDDRTEREKQYEDEIEALRARVAYFEKLDYMQPFLKKK